MSNSMAENSVVSCPPALTVHSFSEKIMDVQVYYQVLTMKDSFHLWIGTDPIMGNTSLSMKSTNSSLATSINLLGDTSNNLSSSIAEKLAKKTGKQVFVSCSLNYDQLMTPLVEKRLFQELKNDPDRF